MKLSDAIALGRTLACPHAAGSTSGHAKPGVCSIWRYGRYVETKEKIGAERRTFGLGRKRISDGFFGTSFHFLTITL